MNPIINFVMKNKLAVWILTIIITAAGIYSGTRMKLETIPDITVPIVSVTTIYPGAPPQQVDDELAAPLERLMRNLKGVSAVSSTSYQNASSLQIEYKFGTDMKAAEEDVKESLSSFDLPENAEEPSVGRISINAFPILGLSVSEEGASLEDLTSHVQNDLVPSLEGIDGVSDVAVTGQQVEEVQLTFLPDKLKQYNLDEKTVRQLIQATDMKMPLGLLGFGSEEQSVVVDGKLTTIEELKKLEIPITPQAPAAGAADSAALQSGLSGQPDGQMPGQMPADIQLPAVTLGDIADIEEVGKAESISRTNGKEAISLQITKSQDANTVTVANGVKDKIEQYQKDNKDFTISTTLDQGEPIEQSIETMLSKAIFGALFAVVIILLFLRNFKSTLISIISIPLSLLIAVLLLNQMDITLNIMTLGAMTVAIGRVIDDSIVVVENIYRRMHLPDEKLKGRELIRESTKQMIRPILSSTLVTIAVFVPLGLVSGMVGELFMPFALTVVFALLASLLVAITIVPMMAHSLFRKQLDGTVKAKKEHHGRLALSYRRMLEWSLNHKVITALISIALLVGSLFLIPKVGVSFLPDEEQKTMYITYTPAPGEPLETVDENAEKAEDLLLGKDDVETVQVSVGGQNPMAPGASNGGLLFVTFDEDTPEFTKVKDDTLAELQNMKTDGEWKSQDFAATGASSQVSYGIYGSSLKDLQAAAEEVETVLTDNKELKDPKTSLSRTYKEYTLEADQEKLTQAGLTTAQIGGVLYPDTRKDVLTKLDQDGRSIDVVIHKDTESLKSIDDLLKQTVMSPLGKEIPVSDLVTVKEGTTSDTVSRKDGKLYASVTADITSKDVGSVSADVQKQIDKLDLPSGVQVKSAGVTEDIAEAFTQLGLAMLAAIAIVYLILVITFGGGLAPLAILFSLPFTVIGALVGLLIAGETISVSAMIGLLMLIGIVVTNAIVLIDRVIHQEQAGSPTREALLEAGATRLRPILMTALATIGALIPLAIGAEGSGLISKGLGVTVIGGLVSSTLLTLVFVPIVYEFLGKFRRKKTAARM
ncbi:efflux RND transporter permease subunit [Sporosarcina trichiuri]|uniref:efflux RND transporter permease subunit n=1 Tax=Sporosarcina trichiuri TaxID=3056445 RepID=UPI0025B3FAEC|nr:efflux RND transporter permease subunit [Sporosarcina sp. 0.2-SM1T-5]WJY28398.1 efflux RND transporter permease subunit [Sporosarcina sp. 0.2-SM1T-5]